MIIGVTGNNGSGKDTFARYLVERKGFEHISLSDFIREETAKRGIDLARNNFHEVANRMREERGAGILAKIARERMVKGKNYVVTSIRNPGEIKALEESDDFVMVSVDAPIKIRFNRIMERNRKNEKELLSFEEFEKFEADELKSLSTSSQQMKECIDMARFKIDNSGSLEAFPKEIENTFSQVELYFKNNSNGKNRVNRRQWGWQNYLRGIFGK